MNTYQFPENAITYFYFLPDVQDQVFVKRKGEYYAAIAVDGTVTLDPEGAPNEDYVYWPKFTPQVIKLGKASYDKLQELLWDIEDPFNPLMAVCVGILHKKGASQLIPFLAHDQEANAPTRTDLIARRGEEEVLAAIAAVPSNRPSPAPKPRGRKMPTAEDNRLSTARTQALHTLLDRCNELPQDQLDELVRIVAAASDGRYIIKMRPADMWLPHIHEAKEQKKT